MAMPGGKGHSGPPLGFQAAQIQLHISGQECGLSSDKGRQSRAREPGLWAAPAIPVHKSPAGPPPSGKPASSLLKEEALPQTGCPGF